MSVGTRLNVLVSCMKRAASTRLAMFPVPLGGGFGYSRPGRPGWSSFCEAVGREAAMTKQMLALGWLFGLALLPVEPAGAPNVLRVSPPPAAKGPHPPTNTPTSTA